MPASTTVAVIVAGPGGAPAGDDGVRRRAAGAAADAVVAATVNVYAVPLVSPVNVCVVAADALAAAPLVGRTL